MEERVITETLLTRYQEHLHREEKSAATISKYIADIRKLMVFSEEREITKELMLEYKENLKEQGYKAASINSFLVAANRFFEYMEWYGVRVKTIKIQKEAFAAEERELTKEEYKKLVDEAKKEGDLRLAMVLMTICATGIRVSELRFLTVDCVRRGMMEVDNKGKVRKVLIPEDLRKSLLAYAGKQKIKRGAVFVNASGKPLHRSSIWRGMKGVCGRAGVKETKVFPHNLRHLFARTYYRVKKDIAKLADILGHSSINTTRIYLKSSSREWRREFSKMGLVYGIGDDS